MDSKPLNDKSLNAKSLLLSILSLLSILFIFITLQASWNNPQEQTKLDLLQTDLILQATQAQENIQNDPTNDIFQVLIGDSQSQSSQNQNSQNIYAQALSSYQEVLSASKSSLVQFDRLALSNTNSNLESDDPQFINRQRQKKQTSISEISLRMGLLQVQTRDIAGAIATWESVAELEGRSMTTNGLTAQILTGIWSEPTMLFPNAETQIRRTLDGWYRQVALTKLYQSQQRSEKLPELEQQSQIEATSAINRLIIVNSIPLVGGGTGILIWLGLLIQWIFFRKSSPFHNSILTNWQVPWGIGITWEVMVLWFTAFCLMTQLVLPLAFELLGVQSKASEDFTLQAWLVLIPYILSVAPMLPILQTSLAAYRPLPEGWFRFKFNSFQWVAWGIGGYFAAVPLVLIVSIISQKFLQGQGGGNPLLPILTDSQNNLPKFLLWTTLAIAAPFFEEYLFRGFLLPSLTKFLPVWGAIALSGFVFALAHLNLADIIPLSILGMVMGFVYWRSGNLLSSMLLHCLWNSGSFFALIALGGK